MFVWIFLVKSCIFFCYIQCRGQSVFFCPAALLTNEGLVPSANQRSVWRDSGIWIAWAAGRVNAGEFLCHIWLPQAKCCWLEKYPSALHWIGESIFELWNFAWLLSPGLSGKRNFPERDITWPYYSVRRPNHSKIAFFHSHGDYPCSGGGRSRYTMDKPLKDCSLLVTWKLSVLWWRREQIYDDLTISAEPVSSTVSR